MMNDTQKIFSWWARLQPDAADDRATLAKMRRAGTVAQLSMLPETMTLCNSVQARVHDLARLSLIAGTLAVVRDHVQGKFAAQLGGLGDRPKLSPLRFQRLIEAETPDEQLTAFRRAIIQNGRAGNIQDLADSLLCWGDGRRGEARRQSWVYDYYQSKNPISKEEASE